MSRKKTISPDQDHKPNAQSTASQALVAPNKSAQVRAVKKASKKAAPQDQDLALKVAPVATEVEVSPVSLQVDEFHVAGEQMALAFQRSVFYHMKHGRLSRAEAEEKALAPATDALTEKILNTDPQRLIFSDMLKLHLRDPELGAQKWKSVQHRAAEALGTGEMHVQALSKSDEESVWKLAQYQAILEELAEGCPPCTGMQKGLLRQIAQYEMLQLQWMQILVERTEQNMLEEVGLSKKLRPPTLSQAQSVEQAAAMLERLHRMSHRLQRAFLDSRKQTSGAQGAGTQVLVQNVGQVNVAQKQVNLSRPEDDAS